MGCVMGKSYHPMAAECVAKKWYLWFPRFGVLMPLLLVVAERLFQVFNESAAECDGSDYGNR